MFTPVSSSMNFPRLEQEVLALWRARDIFHKSLEQRRDAPRYVFYEGPPTTIGRPGSHHILARAFKDLFLRYKTMRGYYVLCRGGWDTHGLPVELEVERELGLANKKEIEDYGIERFNQHCRKAVFRYIEDWKRITGRIGFWMDLKGAYATLHNEYIESLWWVLKHLWERGLIYRDYQVVPYCSRCGTPLSGHELALSSQKATPTPSVYVKFPLRDRPGAYLLVWTTAPWTLPGNVALAVGPDITYVEVEQKDAEGQPERLILAKARLDALDGPCRILRHMKGKALLGKHYQPLYTFLPVANADYARVISGKFVSTREGTGIVHIAPAFGADDMEAARQHGLPILQPVDLQGRFSDAIGPWRGIFVKDADPLIVEELRARGLLYRSGTCEHDSSSTLTGTGCWRCGTPLLPYAMSTWFIATSRCQDRLIANSRLINWHPEPVGGQFGDWLANNVDWVLGRDRYWGTPLPFWVCDQCGHQECIGSLAELSERSGIPLRLLQPGERGGPFPHGASRPIDLHRPYVDEITWRCPRCAENPAATQVGIMRRVPEVADCWFDSGSMPVAQWHYPFENRETFAEQFPADFVCEAIDQTYGWFYTLHAISTLLFDQPCYRNVIGLGLILDEQGQKMSRSRGNVVDLWEVLNAHGADALRWYFYIAASPGVSCRLSATLVDEVAGRFLFTLWDVYGYFVSRANADGWEPEGEPAPETLQPLDRWILSALNQLIIEVTERLDQYDATGAAHAIAAFVDDLSNWYVRRSHRFWSHAGENVQSNAARRAVCCTLYTCLMTLSHLLAPFTPFMAEAVYQNLVQGIRADAPESVHLARWPEANKTLIDESLMADMRLAQHIVNLGQAARQAAQIKAHQTLTEAIIQLRTPEERSALERVAGQIVEELNVRVLRVMEQGGGLVDEVAEYTHSPYSVVSEEGYVVTVSTVLTPEVETEEGAREEA